MYGYIVFGFSCLCTCVHAEKCSQNVQAKRETFHLPLGGNLLLSCVVQHCGEKNWAWSWTWLPIRGTKGFKQADEGQYRCKVIWESGTSDEGHISSVYVKERSLLHRVLVGVSASLCALLALLLLAHCVSSRLKRHQTPGGPLDTSQRDKVPPPLPHGPVKRKNKSWLYKASLNPKVQRQPSTELVYAEVVHDASGDHEQAVWESSQDTVYSSIRPPSQAPRL